jgi:hypothetical protein
VAFIVCPKTSAMETRLISIKPYSVIPPFRLVNEFVNEFKFAKKDLI